MEIEKVLQQAKELLESANLTVDDLVQYCEKGFPFEVMYEGMVRSWVSLEGKKPLGVIFENHLITLKDSPDKVDWYKAKDYCRSVKIDGHACSVGKLRFWKKLVNSSWKQKEALDCLLIRLGGTALGVKRRWSSSEYDTYGAWVFCTDTGAGQGGVSFYSKYYDNRNFVVRPVLDLSDLS